jgi:hypothetical protein
MTLPQRSSVPDALSKTCLVLFGINICFFPVAYFASVWIHDLNGQLSVPDFLNVWAAARRRADHRRPRPAPGRPLVATANA